MKCWESRPTPSSWHGVNKVTVEGPRCCVSNYYFSPDSPTGSDYFNVTSFGASPSQPFRRFMGKLDSFTRNGLRSIFPSGLGKKDIYSPKDHDE